ncbi:ABC1 kinase family protein [Sphingomonas sp. FW199]|uniref:ABC1 kinase family protein n=1 Tax=Sphingomonas sp. FW199 TaxID=3400217 RepID=UPI003CEE1C47
MASNPVDERGRAVPQGRIARLSRFGALAGGVAGGMLAEGARQLAAGKRPSRTDLLLTPANAMRVTKQLAQLRGAAMKLGQLVSMDAGDVLPQELTDILARLRADAQHMPPEQLQRVLAQHWGRDWRTRFARFGARPIAAASIGQVHRATTRDGRDLAIKVQYPGVRESIDSDVDNVATLLRLTGLLPDTIDLDMLLAEAKRQLHEEADYLREGEQMERFRTLLDGDDRYVVPALDTEFTADRVLAMTYVDGVSIERMEDADQAVRDRLMTNLIDLVLRELFEFGWMQTDPNFANYRVQPETGRLVLLDFGAARPVTTATALGYHRMLMAGLDGDADRVREASLAAGFMSQPLVERHPETVRQMIDAVMGELGRDGPFDFADRAVVHALREQGMAVAADRAVWHLPPIETLFAQRKISGTALLAARLRARVDVKSMVAAWRDRVPG